MATKKDKTEKTEKTTPAPKKASTSMKMKAARPVKPARVPGPKPLGPKAKLAKAHGSKETLAKKLAEAVARDDEDTDLIAERLQRASNSQLLRLQAAVDSAKKLGGRTKLIAAISAANKKATDKDYLAKLDTMTLPELLDMHRSVRAHAK
jgi:hypothetical protein